MWPDCHADDLAMQFGPAPYFGDLYDALWRPLPPQTKLYAKQFGTLVHLSRRAFSGAERLPVGYLSRLPDEARIGSVVDADTLVGLWEHSDPDDEKIEIDLDQAQCEELLGALTSLPEEANGPVIVGGDRDCWKAVFLTDAEFERELSVSEFVSAVEEAIVSKLGPSCKEVPVPPPAEMCYICMEEICECDDAPVFPTTSPFDDARNDFKVQFTKIDARRWHLVAYRWFSSAQIEGDGWWSIKELAESGAKDVLIGSSVEIMKEAMRIFGPEILKLKATEAINSDYASTPTVRLRLTNSQMKVLERYVGFPVLSTQSVANTNDHYPLACARELVRSNLDHLFPHNKDGFSALHIGATMQEINRWYSHAGHDFSMPMLESKDAARVFEQAVSWSHLQLKKMNLPAIKIGKDQSFALKFKSLQEMFRVIESETRKRTFFVDRPLRNYDVGFFEDCMYSMTEAEFLSMWRMHEFKVGYAVMFVPDFFVYKDCAESDIYQQSYSLSPYRGFSELIEYIWPAVLAITPFVPWDGLQEMIHRCLKWLFEEGQDILERVMHNVLDDAFPVETVLGVTLDFAKAGPIVSQIMTKILPMVADYVMHVNITWRNGASNGYSHNVHEWKKWAVRRRFYDKTTCVDSEIISRVGEMYLIRFWRSDGQSPIVSKLKLPKERQAVMVADVVSSYSHVLKEIVEPKFFPVRQSDWFQLYNFCMEQPVDSLSFAVVCTALNRIRGGLSLGSRVLVEEMPVQDAHVTKIALACLMEVYRMRNIISDIESDPKFVEDYELNITRLLKNIGKFAAIIGSGGLIVPAYYIFMWLIKEKPAYEFVRYPTDVEVRREPKLVKRVVPQDATVVIRGDAMEAKSSPCDICDARDRAEFSATGVVSDGQLFACSNHGDSKLKISFDESGMTEALGFLRGVRQNHEEMNATKVVSAMREMLTFVEANLAGLSAEVEVDYIRGGPGTGKSVVIRKLATLLEEDGKKCVIGVPFRKLLDDYTNVKVLGRSGARQFQVDTIFYTPGRKSADVLFVDEVSAVDWILIKVYCLYLGVKRLIIVGDQSQTKLRPESGEGRSVFDSDVDFSKIRTHELIKNYRLDAWRVKLLNRLYGYRMVPTNDLELPPKFVTVEQYQELVNTNVIDKAKDHAELVFTHAAARAIFGCESEQRGENPNMSVRSSQGTTCSTSAISATDLDDAVSQAHGMMCVAISRSRGQVYVVCHSLDDPVPQRICRELFCDSDDRKAVISAIICEPPPEEGVSGLMTDQEKRVDKYIRDRGTVGDARVDDIEVRYLKDTTFERDFDAETQDMIDKRDEWVYQQFHPCAIDPIRKKHPELKDKLYDLLVTLWADDDACGRRGLALGLLRGFFSGSPEMRKVDGKFLLPLDTLKEFFRENFVSVLIVEDGVPWFSPSAVLGKPPTICLSKIGSHLEEGTVIKWPVRFSDGHKTKMLPSDSHYGEIVASMPWRGGTFHAKRPKSVAPPVDPAELRRTADARFEDYLKTKGLIRVTRDNWSMDPTLTYARPEDLAVAIVDEPEMVRIVEPFKSVDPWERRLRSLRVRISSGDGVGYIEALGKPSIVRTKKFDWEPHEKMIMESTAVRLGAFKVDPKPLPLAKVKPPKARFGTNCYLLHDFVDQTGSAPFSRLNAVAPALSIMSDVDAEYKVDGFFFSKTRAGRIKLLRKQPFFQIHPGAANHCEDTPMDTVIAASRYGRKDKANYRVTHEFKKWAHELVGRHAGRLWDLSKPLPTLEANFVIDTALTAARQRLYYKRGMAVAAKSFTPSMVFMGKVQRKPIKNGKLDLAKGGQGIMQTPPLFNAAWIPWTRLVNWALKEKARAELFLDDRESEEDFATRLTKKIREMPDSVRFGMVDAVEFDSKQNAPTVFIEKLVMEALGFNEVDIDEYQECRKPGKFTSPGLLTGKTKWEKPSGALDTKSMNTALQLMMSSLAFEGVGPVIEAAKGDDYLRVQSGMTTNHNALKELKTYTGMELVTDVHDGAEFIGTTVSRAGMFPSITRTAMKAISAPVRDEAHFYEQQKAYRDKVKAWRTNGLFENIGFTAAAERASMAYVELCAGFVDSLSHLSWGQFLQVARKRQSAIAAPKQICATTVPFLSF